MELKIVKSDIERLSEIILLSIILIMVTILFVLMLIIVVTYYDISYSKIQALLADDGLYTLATFLVAFMTLLMVFATFSVARENRNLWELQSEPIVSVDAQQRAPHYELIYLIIQNTGLGPAFDIKFKLNCSDFTILSKQSFSELGIMKNGLSYIPHDYELRIPLTGFDESDFNEVIKNDININISYKNSFGELRDNNYPINLSRFQGFDKLAESERKAKAVILYRRDSITSDTCIRLQHSTSSSTGTYEISQDSSV